MGKKKIKRDREGKETKRERERRDVKKKNAWENKTVKIAGKEGKK